MLLEFYESYKYMTVVCILTIGKMYYTDVCQILSILFLSIIFNDHCLTNGLNELYMSF